VNTEQKMVCDVVDVFKTGMPGSSIEIVINVKGIKERRNPLIFFLSEKSIDLVTNKEYYFQEPIQEIR
jgi:hypothetical protein